MSNPQQRQGGGGGRGGGGGGGRGGGGGGGAATQEKTSSLPSGVKILKDAINNGNIGQITDQVYKNLIETLLNISRECTADKVKFDDSSKTGAKISKEVIKTKLIQNIDDCVIRTLKFIVYTLQNDYLDANRFLVWNISLLEAEKIKGLKSDPKYKEMVLLLIAFALRYGADPNLYVMEPEYGKVHILVYTLLRFNEKKLFPSGDVQHDFTKQILLLMCLMGSKVSFKATYPDDKLTFKDSAKANIKIVEEARKKVNPEAENATVRDFMNGVGYKRVGEELVKVSQDQYDEPYEDPKYILDQQKDPSGITKNEFVINYGFLLDDPEYATMDVKGGTLINFDKVLKYNAIRVLQVCKIDDDENEIKYKHESLRILQTIDCIALEAFVELVQRGTKISYFTMNRLILKYKEYTLKENFNRVYSEVYLAMIKSALSLGVAMDRYQLEFIKAINASDSKGNQVADGIETIYRKPLYEKACSTSKKAKLPKSVKLLAASIGVGVDVSNVYRNDKTGQVILSEPSKDEICTGLFSVMQKDPETFRKDAEERLKKRIQYTAPRIDDYTKGRISDLDIYNPDSMFGDPLSYNDATVVYYRDPQDRLFCFPANMFKDLRKTGKNPITNEDLPLEVQVKIEKTLELFKIMGIDSSNIIPVGDAFKRLKEPDSFSKARTAYAEETIKLLFLSRGLRSENLTNLPADSYNKMLRIPEINMEQDYLGSLRSPDFIFATFSKALYSVLKQDENIPKIPHILNQMIKSLGGGSSAGRSGGSMVPTAAGQALLSGNPVKSV
jgi:hypothetical protein